MGQFVTFMHLALHKALLEPNCLEEVPHLRDPLLLDGLEICLRINEILNLHLLKLPGSEEELPGRDLIAEGLANLGNAERDLGTHHVGHLLVVHKDALRSLRPQVALGGAVGIRAHIGLKHEVESPRSRECPRIASGRRRDQGHLLLCGFRHILDHQSFKGLHVRLCGLDQLLRLLCQSLGHVAVLHHGDEAGRGPILQFHFGPHQLIGPEPLLALGTIHHWV
mmetsp:Transcript_32516/g.75164  ORF Transcript_32516/g.75164 Transcript_32516/m.75164 type:complete len:223 (+) Transcript_32516:651-1319(+)